MTAGKIAGIAATTGVAPLAKDPTRKTPTPKTRPAEIAGTIGGTTAGIGETTAGIGAMIAATGDSRSR
jgi:hypothetical protein